MLAKVQEDDEEEGEGGRVVGEEEREEEVLVVVAETNVSGCCCVGVSMLHQLLIPRPSSGDTIFTSTLKLLHIFVKYLASSLSPSEGTITCMSISRNKITWVF